MERNTQTTLGQLRIGDRFRWNLKRVDVWQVTAHIGKSTAVNLPGLGGVMINKHDDLKRASTPVIFMRHTRPEPGEGCLFQDLKDGEVFHLPDDIITEYVVKDGAAFVGVSGVKWSPLHSSHLVIFVRKQY